MNIQISEFAVQYEFGVIIKHFLGSDHSHLIGLYRSNGVKEF